MYKFYQPNEKDVKGNSCDCVIRALCKATKKDWLTVYDDLYNIGREIQFMPNSKEVYELYLVQNGFTYIGISNKKGSKRPTISSFSKDNKNNCVVRVAHHLVCCYDGNYYDIWDSGHKSLYGYWIKNN